MTTTSKKMPTTWTYGIIWTVIMAVAAIVPRYILWFFLAWRGDPDVFSDSFCGTSITLLCISALIGIVMYLLVSYNGYRKLAANNITDLHGVYHGKYGKPYIKALILTAVLEILFFAVGAVLVIIVEELNFFLKADDLTVILTFLMISGISIVADEVLVGLGSKFFKPKEVMQKK